MHDDAGFVQRSLHGFLRIENLANFLERTAPCLDKEEVYEDEFEYIPEDEEEVILCQKDWLAVLPKGYELGNQGSEDERTRLLVVRGEV
jgi:hypothetical protein